MKLLFMTQYFSTYRNLNKEIIKYLVSEERLWYCSLYVRRNEPGGTYEAQKT